MKLIADRSYFPTLMGLLSSAQRQIDIFAYSFAIGSAAGRIDTKGAPFQIASFLTDLKAMYGDQLKVRLYMEGLRDTIDRNRVTGDFLRQAGIEVFYGSTHAKAVCVDQKSLLIGSTNFTQQSIMRNPEANLLIDDQSALVEFERYFEFMWSGGRHGGIHLNLPLLADGDFEPKLIEMIDAAERTLEFFIYFFDHPKIEAALIRAHRRGVKITGLIHRHAKFAMSYIRRNYRTVRNLRSAGIHNLFFGQPFHFSHSKYMIADSQKIALGTGNWLLEDVEIHPQLHVYVEDSQLAKRLRTHLQGHLPRPEQQIDNFAVLS